MEPVSETIRVPQTVVASLAPPEDILESITGPERVLGILPFVADVSMTPRWHHLLFTEDKVLAVPAFPEPARGAARLYLPSKSSAAEPYPPVLAALRLVVIPQPLTPAHVTVMVPYAAVRRVRLTRGHVAERLPELGTRAGRRSTWWFFRKDDGSGDLEKARYARDLLCHFLPFPIELVGFVETPRPPEWHLRRGAREPLPLLAISAVRTSTHAEVRER